MIRVLLSLVVLVAMSAPAEAGLLANLLGRVQRSSGCPGGNCNAQAKAPAAVKPMPLPCEAATERHEARATRCPKTVDRRTEASGVLSSRAREGRYGEILVGNDFTPGGSDFDGPVDYIPVAPKPTPSK